MQIPGLMLLLKLLILIQELFLIPDLISFLGTILISLPEQIVIFSSNPISEPPPESAPESAPKSAPE